MAATGDNGPQGIHVRALLKRFGSVQALDGVDLSVEAGEVVALLGPNGAGKSTLLRILGTTVLPDSGTVTVAGVDVVADPVSARRNVGLMIGDERSLYWRISARRNLTFFAALHGIRKRRARVRAEELLGAVGLADAADRAVLGYSSGMRARLSLARALIARPPLLLLDEPTRSLDPVAGVRFRETAVELARGERTGILFATHDLHEAAAVADRVVVLAQGRVVFEDSLADADAADLERSFLTAVNAHRPEPVEKDAAETAEEWMMGASQ
ncbi:MAG: ABC transporter ATP-binding protein [Solirubrobacterales bacterium]